MRALGKALALASGLAAGLLGACDSDAGPTLAQASQEVQFDSVARLGPHRLSASIRRQDLRDDVVLTDVLEGVEVQWQSWDAFEMRRAVDGKRVSAVRVTGGSAWSEREDGGWTNRGDPEPWRQELRLAWNAWDQALSPFQSRLLLTEIDEDVVEGRRVRRYAVGLRPLPEPPAPDDDDKAKGKGRRRTKKPADDGLIDLSGEVTLDAATAARLVAQVQGRYRQGDRIRTVRLDLTRSGIGADLDLTVPTPAPKKAKAGKAKRPAPDAAPPSAADAADPASTPPGSP